MVICCAWKDKRRVLVLRKKYKNWVGREISWKGMWAAEGFVPGKGSVEVLGSKVNGEHGEQRWSHLTFILPLYLHWQRVFFLPFIFEANHIGTLLDCCGFLVTLVMMIPWSGLTQNLCLWPPYICPLRTMRSHTLQFDWSARHCPSQWWLWGLGHHKVPLCPSTWASGCWGRPWYNFPTPDTSVCLILVSGDSGAWCFFSWPSDFLLVPFILWFICPPSILLPPPSLYEPLPNTFHPISALQSPLVTSTLDHPLPVQSSWGA